MPEQASSFADAPRETLRELVARYGTQLTDDPRRLRSLLRDLVGEHRLEISALVVAAEEGVGRQLLDSSGSLGAATAARLVDQLQSERALSAKAAKWSVEAWAEALDMRLVIPPPRVDAEPDADPELGDPDPMPAGRHASVKPESVTSAPIPADVGASTRRSDPPEQGQDRRGWIPATVLGIAIVGIVGFVLTTGGGGGPGAQASTTTTSSVETTIQTTSSPGFTTVSGEPTCPVSLGTRALDDSKRFNGSADNWTETLVCVYREGDGPDFWELSGRWEPPGGETFLCEITDFEPNPEADLMGGFMAGLDRAASVSYRTTDRPSESEKELIRAASRAWLPDVKEMGVDC